MTNTNLQKKISVVCALSILICSITFSPLFGKESTAQTALMKALAEQNYDDAVKALQSGANVNEPSDRNITPLYAAAHQGNLALVKLLVKNGAKVNKRLSNKSTPLHIAANFGYSEVINFLCTHGANPNATFSEGNTPLIYAVQKQDVSSVATLILHGALPGKRRKDGMTPLFLAAYLGNLEIVKMLITARAYINPLVYPDLKTPLHAAAYSGHREIVKFLLEHGADYFAATRNGSTAITLARKKNHDGIIALLTYKFIPTPRLSQRLMQ